jgi:Recombination endonuclease VII
MDVATPEDRKEVRRKWKIENPEKVREQKRRWRERKGMTPRGTQKTHCRSGHEMTPGNIYIVNAAGKRRCKICQKLKYKPKIKTLLTPEQRLRSAQNSRLKKNGWTKDMFEATMIEQGERCAICRLSMDRPCADHAHTKPPEPRGVLCDGCNTAIGLLRENPETCRAAAEYLEAWA